MRAANRGLAGAMPWVFVLIWSTGFVVARYAMPHSPPLSFLSLRYALSLIVFGVWIGVTRATWPRHPRQWLHLSVSGMLMHAGYLGGVWSAVRAGMGAATVALLVGLQPVLTAVWLSMSSHPPRRSVRPEIVSLHQWAGLLLGLLGLTLVVWPKLVLGEVTPLNLAMALFALLSISIGTLYQKHFVRPADVRTANFVQLLAALVVSLPLAWLEPGRMELHPHMLGALTWSVFVLTLGGSSLLYLLIQRGAATRVTSLLYLVPACTAVLAWLLFGEMFTIPMLCGLALTVLGVALVVRDQTA
jgi:drug/metabolite transporter (DMT)-like permease